MKFNWIWIRVGVFLIDIFFFFIFWIRLQWHNTNNGVYFTLSRGSFRRRTQFFGDFGKGRYFVSDIFFFYLELSQFLFFRCVCVPPVFAQGDISVVYRGFWRDNEAAIKEVKSEFIPTSFEQVQNESEQLSKLRYILFEKAKSHIIWIVD